MNFLLIIILSHSNNIIEEQLYIVFLSNNCFDWHNIIAYVCIYIPILLQNIKNEFQSNQVDFIL